MPLILPAGLPAVATLRHEGITVIEDRGPGRFGPDQFGPEPFAPAVQPLTVALVNIMPDKAVTEAQFGRLLAGGDRPVRMVLALPDGYRPQSADPGHVERYYRPWSAVDRRRLDGAAITGAPVEQLDYLAGRYWDGLTAIRDRLTAAGVPGVHGCRAARFPRARPRGFSRARVSVPDSGWFGTWTARRAGASASPRPASDASASGRTLPSAGRSDNRISAQRETGMSSGSGMPRINGVRTSSDTCGKTPNRFCPSACFGTPWSCHKAAIAAQQTCTSGTPAAVSQSRIAVRPFQ